MSAPPIIHDLVRAFQKDERTYYDNAYSEAQVRISFIDPFLEALGWHPRPDPAYIAEWRDCIVEQSLNVKDEQHKKRADYTCRVGKTPVLIVEAKAPRDDVFTMPTHALQIRRYAHSQTLPIGALTNFAQLAIYDGRVPPKRDDAAIIAQLETIRFTEYVEKWDLIESLLSENAVRRGAQREYLQRRTAKGILPVGQAILADIDRWREELVAVIHRLNPSLDAETLGFALGRIIDRILFLRVCEARDTEPEGRLKSLLKGPDVYPRLLKLFHLADERYNSGLFYFKEERGRAEKPDLLALRLQVEDKPLKQIISGLYYPDNLYEYSLIPVEILGQVYEQFLGKVVIIPRRGTAKIEPKPEVKKAGGVYYTPSYIVNYIVEHTIGKLVEGKTPKQIAKLRILDPACGSGSFLLGAYQYLLDRYLKYYLKDGPAKHQKEVTPDIREGYRLTLRERKRILLAHIYGVDIDPQAVEVSKLSMHLKVLDGETRDTVELELKLGERALPDLGKNIKCGNSLIATDILNMTFPSASAGGQKGGSENVGTKGGSGSKGGRTLSDDEISRINPFDWKKEFPAIFKDGGFDAVIGNPPWGADLTKPELQYLKRKHERIVDRMIDTYIYFVDQSLLLARTEGLVSFVVPQTILNQTDATRARDILLERRLSRVVAIGQGVFGKKASNSAAIFVTNPRSVDHDFLAGDLSEMRIEQRSEAINLLKMTSFAAWRAMVQQDPHRTFFVSSTSGPLLLNQLRKRLGCLADLIAGTIQRGVSPDVAAAHVVALKEARAEFLEKGLLRPSISGERIKRYKPWESDRFILYTTRDTPIADYPHCYARLKKFRRMNTCKEVKEGKHPYWALHRPRDAEIFRSPKIIGITTSKAIELIYDESASLFVTDAMYVFSLKPRQDPYACLAVLQSKLFLFLYRVANQGQTRVIPQVKAAKLLTLPTPRFDPSCESVRQVGILCKRMLKLHRNLQAEWVGPKQEAIERQIKATNEEIDRLVYELYGLTEDEIRIVESA